MSYETLKKILGINPAQNDLKKLHQYFFSVFDAVQPKFNSETGAEDLTDIVEQHYRHDINLMNKLDAMKQSELEKLCNELSVLPQSLPLEKQNDEQGYKLTTLAVPLCGLAQERKSPEKKIKETLEEINLLIQACEQFQKKIEPKKKSHLNFKHKYETL